MVEAVASGVQSHPQIHKELGGYPGLHKTLSQKKEEVGNIAYLVERLPGMERVLGLIPSTPNWAWGQHVPVSNKQITPS